MKIILPLINRAVLLFVILCVMVLSISVYASDATDSIYKLDDTHGAGDHLGKNCLQRAELIPGSRPSVLVLCNTLNMYENASVRSRILRTLRYGDLLELIQEEASEGLLYVARKDMHGDQLIEQTGWVDLRFVAVNPDFYIAMHLTPVYAFPSVDGKVITTLNTYNSLHILAEYPGFYCVSIRGAAGFVEKE